MRLILEIWRYLFQHFIKSLKHLFSSYSWLHVALPCHSRAWLRLLRGLSDWSESSPGRNRTDPGYHQPETIQHYGDVMMSAMASQITSLTIVYSTFYSRRRSKKTSKLRVTGLCEGNSPVTGEFPAQRASNAENVSVWWRHHGVICFDTGIIVSQHLLTNKIYDKKIAQSLWNLVASGLSVSKIFICSIEIRFLRSELMTHYL